MSEGVYILIVDDNPSNIDVLSDVLSDHRRCVAIDGPTALRLAQTRPPDLILLDVMMPRMDGFEVCRQLKANPATASIPVIFITGLGDERSETLGFEVGGVDYITKPFNAKVVRARVQTQIELKAVRDALCSENSQLEARVEARTAELHAALQDLHRSALDTVFRLGLAAEFKDDDTGQHVLRMADYAVAVARELGWDPKRLDLLLHAAPMHDIGKIAVPDGILKKPGPLDAGEWEIIKRHPLIGARILSASSSEVIRLAEVVALTHHEKWNGSGYPHGIAGESIPLVGRIVAVCDVFDALTVRRPYKEPFALPAALSIIRDSSGSHFDPGVVAAFFRAEQAITAIRNRYSSDERKARAPDYVFAEANPG